MKKQRNGKSMQKYEKYRGQTLKAKKYRQRGRNYQNK